jgi:hypothetical protein
MRNNNEALAGGTGIDPDGDKPTTMTRDELVRMALKRLAFHAEHASEFDFGRLEELGYLLFAALYCNPEPPIDRGRIAELFDALGAERPIGFPAAGDGDHGEPRR